MPGADMLYRPTAGPELAAVPLTPSAMGCCVVAADRMMCAVLWRREWDAVLCMGKDHDPQLSSGCESHATLDAVLMVGSQMRRC
eukprot:2318227-Rhodomonas_salina.2